MLEMTNLIMKKIMIEDDSEEEVKSTTKNQVKLKVMTQ